MIRLDRVSKRYPGTGRAAVDDLSLEIPDGMVTALIGPSGCGKSTTLRMVNRLVEPDSGAVYLDDTNVADLRPEELRRQLGYAIQGVGLFPHWSVEQNIGTVPRLLGWERARIGARVAELLELMGLEPGVYGCKYPAELSGGEAQRVGVARALAADPPVLLMDEPFGAVDPLTRERLQVEFLRIQRALRKTVVFVTHDMDEAVRLADRIVVMREGRIVQSDTPERVLAYPVDEFVGGFVGAERALKRLSLAPVSEALGPVGLASGSQFAVGTSASMREALAKILEEGASAIAVVDDAGNAVGSVSLETIVERFRRPLS